MSDTSHEKRRQLQSLKLPNWTSDRLERIRTLDPLTAAVGRGLLGESDPLIDPPTDKPSKSRRGLDFTFYGESTARAVALNHLHRLSHDQLSQLLQTLFPRIATLILLAHDFLPELPYQFGFNSKAFRAPNHPDLYRSFRTAFIHQLLQSLEGHDPDLNFIVENCAYLSWGGIHRELGLLFAALASGSSPEADAAHQRMLTALADGAASGDFGHWVLVGLLASRRPDGWDAVISALLAAQRQEGLRQAILESADLAQLPAFSRILRTIEEHDMGRFASVVRAVDVWAGLLWDSESKIKIDHTLSSLRSFLDDEDARQKALAGSDPELAYFALWASAAHDAPATIPLAARFRDHPNPEFRWVGVHLLCLLGLADALPEILPFLHDKDLRVAARALDTVAPPYGKVDNPQHAVIPALKSLLHTHDTSKPSDKPLVWPWVKLRLSADTIVSRILRLADLNDLLELAPRLPDLEVQTRAAFVKTFADHPVLPEVRTLLLTSLQDAAPTVREAAAKAINDAKIALAPDEAAALEPLLDRKSADLRKSLLALFAAQPDDAAIATASRLLARKTAEAQTAGLELLSALLNSNRAPADIATTLKTYTANQKRPPTEVQRRLLENLQSSTSSPSAPHYTLDNALGLLTGLTLSPIVSPQRRNVSYFSPAADALLVELDELIHQHRDHEFTTFNDETITLGAANSRFPSHHQMNYRTREPITLPLHDIWESFWKNRKHRDPDGQEVPRMGLRLLSADGHHPISRYKPADWIVEAINRKSPPLATRYPALLRNLVTWFPSFDPTLDRPGSTFAIDVLEDLAAHGPPPTVDDSHHAFAIARRHVSWQRVLESCQYILHHLPDIDRAAILPREWSLARYNDRPTPDFPRNLPELALAFRAHAAGIATDAELLDLFFVPAERGYLRQFHLLHVATSSILVTPAGHTAPPAPQTTALIQRVIDRIIHIETNRTESETPATLPALNLGRSGGLPTVVAALNCLDSADLLFGGHLYSLDATTTSRPAVMTHLLHVSSPRPEDTPEAFISAIKPLNLPPKKLVGLAVLNPAWSPHVQALLNWPSLEDAVWWVYAHTRGAIKPWGEGERITAELAKRTPVAPADLSEGAVDVAWFHRVHNALGSERWDILDSVAKLASSGGTGHARARLFADALRGQVSRSDLLTRVKSKRNQDALRALGLVALATGKIAKTSKATKPVKASKTRASSPDPARADLRERYLVMQDFLRTSKQFGSQRQASEKRAASIAMDNLARTAGYPDPIRLTWAMEADAVQDLGQGPVAATASDTTVTLAITPDGDITLDAAKKGKPLKDIPPAAKKDKSIAELIARKTDLTRAASRMRQGLEESMIRGDSFSASELRDLVSNALLRPMLERLVFIGDGIRGYPVNNARGLRDHSGHIEPVKPAESLRIAHPHDLLRDKWSLWQRECLAAERVQPFKQVFRELYIPTDSEKAETKSRRLAGQQVSPRQALALLGKRGWVVAPGEGVTRTFHTEGLTAALSFQQTFYTPAEIDGLTLEAVHFFLRNKPEPLPCAKVPPRLFSEIMRDLDLVVSVAHRGGVDPEASQSTIELRSALVSETAKLLSLKNVRIKDRHIHIQGKLAEYTVHLGSAQTHLVPGGALPIVAVHSQHQGRLFLPFADPDPKTAEVLSKTLLLARDTDIKDPTLIQQIKSRSN